MTLHLRAGFAAIALAAMLAACSGESSDNDTPADDPAVELPGDGTDTDSPDSTDTPDTDDTDTDTDDTDNEAAGDIDCSAITAEELGTYTLYAQLLAQVDSTDSVETLKSGSLGYTPEAFDAILDDLDMLRGHPADGQEDPAAALDTLEEMNDMMEDMLEAPAVTQADIDAFVAVSGGIQGLSAIQIPINSSLNQNCPDIA